MHRDLWHYLQQDLGSESERKQSDRYVKENATRTVTFERPIATDCVQTPSFYSQNQRAASNNETRLATEENLTEERQRLVEQIETQAEHQLLEEQIQQLEYTSMTKF